MTAILDRQEERRVHPRIECAIQAEYEGGVECEILDLSLGGAQIAMPEQAAIPPEVRVRFSVFETTSGGGNMERRLQLLCRVRRRALLSVGSMSLGVEFQNLSQPDMEFLSHYIDRRIRNEILLTIERVLRVGPGPEIANLNTHDNVSEWLDALQREQTQLTLAQPSVDALLLGHIVLVEPEQITLELDPSAPTTVERGTAHVVFVNGHFNYYFQAMAQPGEGRCVTLRSPLHIYSFDVTRSEARTPAPNAYVEIPAPYPPGARLKFDLIDVSPNGLAIRVPVDGICFFQGTPLREIALVGTSVGEQTSRSGEVMNISPMNEGGGVRFLRVGVKLVPPSGGHLIRHVPPPPRPGFLDRMLEFVKRFTRPDRQKQHLAERIHVGSLVDVVHFPNTRRENIVGILNTAGGDTTRLYAPVVIVPQAFGKRKESTYALALTLLENFKQRQKPLVVLRLDGTRTLGESHKDADCREPGKESLRWTLSNAIEDLEATLDYVYDNPRFHPTQVILISPSIQAIPVRKLLARGPRNKVNLWISMMGVPALQEVLRGTSGGIDYVGNFARGQVQGNRQVLSVLLNMDELCSDATRHGMAFVGDARMDMTRVSVPVVWFYGEYDSWIDRTNVMEIMSAPSPASRKTLGLEVGHIPLNGDEALRCFREITRALWQHLYEEEIEPISPGNDDLKRVRQLEWSRTPRHRLADRQGYWRNYLLGDKLRGGGYDIFEFFPEYRSFIARELELLKLEPGHHIADMGCGIGNLPYLLFSRYGGSTAWKLSSVTMVDFVPEALERGVARVKRYAQAAGQKLPPIHAHVVNLQLSPLRTIERFLRGEFFGYDALRGVIPGLNDYSLELWKRMASWRIHEILRGRLMTPEDDEFLLAELPKDEHAVLRDFNRLARFVQQKAVPADGLPSHRDAPPRTLRELRFEALQLEDSHASNLRLPFADAVFDRIVCSLVLSYLDAPVETLAEYVRCLKPGGRLVFSSMMPDVDSGHIYLNALRELESGKHLELPEGYSRETLTEGIRSHMNSVAFLLQLAEEVQFRFFSKLEMRQMAERAGLSGIEIFESYGSPKQAFIVVAKKA